MRITLAFFKWWYGRGWARLGRECLGRLRRTYLAFSVPILAKTLFAPWKRIISYGERSLAENLRAGLDNAVSRLVGFGVRLVVLVAALVSLVVGGLAGLLLLVAWPLAPVAGVVLIIKGFGPW